MTNLNNKLISAIITLCFLMENTGMTTLPSVVHADKYSLRPMAAANLRLESAMAEYAKAVLNNTADSSASLFLQLDDASIKRIEDIGIDVNEYESLALGALLFSPSKSPDEILARQAMIKSINSLPQTHWQELYDSKDALFSLLTNIFGLFENHNTAIRALETIDFDLMKLQGRMRQIEEATTERKFPVTFDRVEESMVFLNIYTIYKNKEAFKRFCAELKETKDPLLQEILKQMDSKVGDISLPDMEKLMTFFKDGRFRKDIDELLVKSHNLLEIVGSIGAALAFAKFVKEKDCAAATFDVTRPHKYEVGWNFHKPKEQQKKNPSASDTTVTLLTGSNMSGKTHYLEQNLYIQLTAQAFGFIPAESGNIRIYEQIVFIDRVSTSSFFNLSAFGIDAKKWRKPLESIGKRSLWLVDEGFSTTSPQDQARLLNGALNYLRQRGAKLMLATHNEGLIEREAKKPDVSVYHFAVEIIRPGEEIPPLAKGEDMYPKEEGKDSGFHIIFKHELKKGAEDSRALEVARVLGLQNDVICRAEDFLRGKARAITKVGVKKLPEIEKYSSEERKALKQKRGDFLAFFPYEDTLVEREDYDPKTAKNARNRLRWRYGRLDLDKKVDVEKNGMFFDRGLEDLDEFVKYIGVGETSAGFKPLFHRLCHTRDFDTMFSSISPDSMTGIDADTLKHIHSLINFGGSRNPKDIIERQKMFQKIISDGGFYTKEGLRVSALIEKVRLYLDAINVDSEIYFWRQPKSVLEWFNIYLLYSAYKDIMFFERYGYEESAAYVDLFAEVIDINLKLIGSSREKAHITEDMQKLLDSKNSGSAAKDIATRIYERLGGTAFDPEAWQRSEIELPVPNSEGIGDFRPISTRKESNWPLIENIIDRLIPYAERVEASTMGITRGHISLIRYLKVLLEPNDVIEELTDYLKSYDSVYLHQLANYIEFLLRPIVRDLKNGQDFLRKPRGEIQRDKYSLLMRKYPFQVRNIYTELKKLEDLFTLALIIKQSRWAPVVLHSKPELHIKKPWNIIERKNKQVRNDVYFNLSELVRLYSGSNMSGKTYHLKQIVWCILAAQAIGFAPCDGITMPIFDNIIYLDRVQRWSDRNLSAFGAEVYLWKDFFEITSGSGLTFAAVDEAGASTSPHYQSAISYAIAESLLEDGNILAMASHNHDFISGFSEINKKHCKVYHFRTRFKNEKIKFDYKIEKGDAPSDGVRVAASMGLGMITSMINSEFSKVMEHSEGLNRLKEQVAIYTAINAAA